MRVDLPGKRRHAGPAARVDGDDDRLVAVGVGGAAHQLRIGDGGGVDARLVGAGQQQLAHIFDRADAAADGERQEDALGGGAHDVERRRPALGGGRDVEVADLVGALRVVGGGDRHGIAGVAQLLELNAFFDPPAVDVEAGDDPLAQHA